MKPKIIRNEEMHEAALSYVETLMDADPGSSQEEELELWTLLIEPYEKEHHPIDPPDPIEAIRFRMDQLGLHRRDLEAFIGQKSKVSEVLNRRRPLSLKMIRSLHYHLGISAAVLVGEASPLKSKKALVLARAKRAKKKGARSRCVIFFQAINANRLKPGYASASSLRLADRAERKFLQF